MEFRITIRLSDLPNLQEFFMLQHHLIVKYIKHHYCKGKGRHFSMAVAHDDSKPAGYRTKDNYSKKVPSKQLH